MANQFFSLLDSLQSIGALAVAANDIDASGAPTSLKVKVSAGKIRKSDGTALTYAGGTLTLGASVTSYLWLDDTATLQSNTTGFPAGVNIVPLASVVTGAAIITSIADAQVHLFSFGRSLGTQYTVLAPVTFTTGTVTLDGTKGLNIVNFAGAVAATLPAASTMTPGQVLTVIDGHGTASTNNITISRAGADTINGGTSVVINTNYGGVRCWCDGVSAWFVIP